MEKNMMILGENYSVAMDTNETQLNNNVLVVGCSGAGKTRGIVEPNLCQATGSYIISDPKGNLHAKYEAFLKKKGYVVKKLDFTNPLGSAHYNFFNYIRSATDVVKVAHMLMKRSCDLRRVDPFWDEAAQLLLEALIAYLFELDKKDFAHFGTLMQLLELMDVSGDFPDRKSGLDTLMEARKNEDPDSFAYSCFHKIMIATGRTLKSIFITVNARLGLFDTPELIEMMKTDDIDIESIGQRKTAIFVVVSDTDRSMDLLANIFFSQAANVLCTYADTKCSGYKLPVPVRFILDDFATNCIIHDAPKLISSIRSRAISMMLMIQSESQLISCFGEDGKTIIANSDTYVYMGGNDVDMAEKIAKRCNVPLRNVLEMPVGESWIFRRGNKPVYVTNFTIKNDGEED